MMLMRSAPAIGVVSFVVTLIVFAVFGFDAVASFLSSPILLNVITGLFCLVSLVGGIQLMRSVLRRLRADDEDEDEDEDEDVLVNEEVGS